MQSLISSANSTHSKAAVSWAALNQIVSAQGSPRVDPESFQIEYESNPILKSLVSSFNNSGIVLQTDAESDTIDAASDSNAKSSSMQSAAKQATKRALKK